jgi:hypothetical protein
MSLFILSRWTTIKGWKTIVRMIDKGMAKLRVEFHLLHKR